MTSSVFATIAPNTIKEVGVEEVGQRPRLPVTWYLADAGPPCGFKYNGRDPRQADSAQSQLWL
jgi:hypothetical protein